MSQFAHLTSVLPTSITLARLPKAYPNVDIRQSKWTLQGFGLKAIKLTASWLRLKYVTCTFGTVMCGGRTDGITKPTTYCTAAQLCTAMFISQAGWTYVNLPYITS